MLSPYCTVLGNKQGISLRLQFSYKRTRLSQNSMVEAKRTTHLRRKIKFEDEPTTWSHHRGGWTNVISSLHDLYAHDGVLCISAIEESVIFDGKTIDQPWVAFVHHVSRNNFPHYPDLERLVENEHFIKSLEKCCGLFTLCNPVKRYLLEKLKPSHPNLSVAKIFYPLAPFPEEKRFDWRKFDEMERKQVIFVGMCLRNFQPFFDLDVPHGFQKYLLKPPNTDFNDLYDCNKQPVTLQMNDSVIIKDRVDDNEYDDLLSSSIVFLNMYDAPAITTVVECLGRNTPIVINRLPGVEEYLGREYPLLYETLDEAEKMLLDRPLLEKATAYLKSHPLLPQLTQQAFLEAFASSSIYRSLPLPPSQRGDLKQIKFPQFDLTVVICSYKRVYNLKSLLDCFKEQDYQGTFELILWNNNSETHEAVAEIAAPYMDELNIRLIQSTQNYYCIIRLAVANLMQSDLLLICDDDVVPKPNYISTFISKYKKYGPRVALCCRGHVFSPHALNEEDPHQFWRSYCNEHLKFCGEELPDREIHFIHADNCLIPRKLLLEVSTYDLPSPDYILVDDYWISFVLSHHMRVPLWKIRGDTILTYTDCSEDQNIALYYNNDVQEQRVNFYVYHMKQGWPASVSNTE